MKAEAHFAANQFSNSNHIEDKLTIEFSKYDGKIQKLFPKIGLRL